MPPRRAQISPGWKRAGGTPRSVSTIPSTATCMRASWRQYNRSAAILEGFRRGGMGMCAVVAAEPALDLGLAEFSHHRPAVRAAGAVVGGVELIQERLRFRSAEGVMCAYAAVAGRPRQQRVAQALQRLAAAVLGQLLGEIGQQRRQRLLG